MYSNTEHTDTRSLRKAAGARTYGGPAVASALSADAGGLGARVSDDDAQGVLLRPSSL
jgi:hypothetical protein